MKIVLLKNVNIVCPGTFNFEKKKPPYVVFLQCESEELEDIEYKPDFPYSRLHITIYEGDDYSYAEKLYQLLCSFSWHFKLLFESPRKLLEQKVGSKSYERPDFQAIFEEIIGEGYQEFLKDYDKDIEVRLKLMRRLLQELKIHLEEVKPEKIQSVYQSSSRLKSGGQKKTYRQMKDGVTLPFLDEEPVTFHKPVTDAIYITPPEYARDMVKCGLEAMEENHGEIDFGDSAIGTGTLFLALRLWIDEINRTHGSGHNYRIRSAIGIDIDRQMADEASIRCHKRGLKVIYGDALLPHMDLGEKRNFMVVNPPFNRHGDIPKEYRELLHDSAKEQTGISIAGNAGLYVYHLLIMDKWLCDGGVAVWLLPAVFMQVRYGEAVRRYLLDCVQLIKIHIYNEEVEQFDSTNVSTAIVVFRKGKTEREDKVQVSYGASVEHPIDSKRILREELVKNMDNWRVVLKEEASFGEHGSKITFDDLFEIKRGVATGANDFFVMTREKAREFHIPDIALKPLIPKARYLKSLVIEEREDGYPDVEPQLVMIDCALDEERIQEMYPGFHRYLQLAKVKEENGVAVVDRFLVRNRHPWYRQERREPPVFLLTYMGRNKKNLPPLYFIWNKSQAVALNTYLLLYPRKGLKARLRENPALHEIILDALNKSAQEMMSFRARVYSGGLKKVEPNELRRMPIIGLNEFLQ